ncbi:MAG: TIGR00159 family protein [Nitrospirae bacterium]|nr:TIGR00159 family protein [Nitrospirota bacterium]
MGNFIDVIRTLRVWDIIDILIVAFVFYKIFLIIKGTRALQMLVGILILLLAFIASGWLELYTIDWLVQSFWSQIVIALIVLFQPEIRRTLAQMGQNPLLRTISPIEETRFIEEIIRAAVSLANKKIGAIIVLERETELKELIEMGTSLDAKISKEILTSIFLPYSPIHDGAVIIKDGRIAAAGCFLPLTMSTAVSKTLGTRHRAAIGITEETDAAVIVISEETGTISVAMEGKMTRDLDAASLRRVLTKVFITGRKERRPFIEKITSLLPIKEKPQ